VCVCVCARVCKIYAYKSVCVYVCVCANAVYRTSTVCIFMVYTHIFVRIHDTNAAYIHTMYVDMYEEYNKCIFESVLQGGKDP